MAGVTYHRHPEARAEEAPLAARAGELIFFAGNLAWSPTTGIPEECRPVPGYPNHWSQINRDLTYVYGVLDRILAGAGSSLVSTLKLNSYHTHAADTFEGLRLRGDWFDRDGPPASTLVLVPHLPVTGARAMIDGVSVLADAGHPRRAHASGTPGAPMPPHEQIWGYKIYSKAVAGGGLIFTSGRTNNVIGSAGAKPDPLRPYQQNRPREATAVILDYLLAMLDDLGVGKDLIVKADIHVSDMAFVPELDRVWRDRFGADGPARSIMPSTFPTDNTIIEVEFVCIDPASGIRREQVVVPGIDLADELAPHATRAGDLLFLSGISTRPEAGRNSPRPALEHALERAEAICAAGGADIGSCVRQRAAYDDLHWLGIANDVWREAAGARVPPTSAFSSACPLGERPSAHVDLVAWCGR